MGGWYALGAGLGVISLLARLVLSPVSPAASAVSLVLLVLAAAAVLLTGRAAKMKGLRPAWQGTIPGLLFAAIGGLALLLVRTTPHEIELALQARHVHVSPAALHAAVALNNSPGFKAVGFAVNLVIWGALSLFFGWVGSLLAPSAQGHRDV